MNELECQDWCKDVICNTKNYEYMTITEEIIYYRYKPMLKKIIIRN